jgi:hypothetical protein
MATGSIQVHAKIYPDSGYISLLYACEVCQNEISTFEYKFVNQYDLQDTDSVMTIATLQLPDKCTYWRF